MLHQLHLLVSDAEQDSRTVASGLRGWRPAVLVPRQLCVFESVACAQVRLHEIGSFARVQAKRLSPFRRTGGSAVRRGGRLHLWLWDAEEVDRLLVDSVHADVRRVAESLYLPWPGDNGAYVLTCTQTEDSVVCEEGAMVAAVAGRSLPLNLSALSGRRAAYDWLGGSLDEGAATGLVLDRGQLFNRLGLFVLVVAFGYAGYEGGQLRGGEDLVREMELRLAGHMEARSQSTVLESSVRADSQWLDSYLTASAQLDVAAALAAIRPVMESHGVVIRELDSAGSELNLVFVTAGGEMQLPSLLQDLRQVRGIRSVQLREHKELGEATFILEVPGFVRQSSLRVEQVSAHDQH